MAYNQFLIHGHALIPVRIRSQLGMKGNSHISMEIEGDRIMITPLDSDKRKREKWIDTWFNRYRFDKAAHMNTMGNITAVELYGQVGISKPSPIDKYDEKTGIAVAYAKAHGADIPKYI